MRDVDIEALMKMTLEEVKEKVKTEAVMKLWEFLKREEKRKNTHSRDNRGDELACLELRNKLSENNQEPTVNPDIFFTSHDPSIVYNELE